MTRSFFQSKNAAAIRHIGDRDQTVVVEGPYGWARVDDTEKMGSDFEKTFALGHQFHAFLFYFDEIVSNPRDSDKVLFQGEEHRALTGEYPHGGMVHLITDEGGLRAKGLVFEFPESEPIVATFSDWRDFDQFEVPFRVTIDDGQRVFSYRYTDIDIEPKTPLWFFEAVSLPSLDEIQVYRLHRQLLAAHCLGDADMIARLSSAQILSVNNGAMNQVTNPAARDRFSALFERLDYKAYYDIVTPVIEIAEGSDLGWVGVNVRAVGEEVVQGTPFENQWAWLMIVRKEDGKWLHAGNASNLANQSAR
ncbi:MAG: hypothetical protein GWP58_14475 [Gammaproteobacteria bacterium]|nr:hypothetical protein [Gammaproteobacteria bacterium]